MTGQFSDWNNVKAASAAAQSPLSLLILGTYLPVSRQKESSPSRGSMFDLWNNWGDDLHLFTVTTKKSLSRPKVVQGRLEVKPLRLFPRDQEQESEHKAV